MLTAVFETPASLAISLIVLLSAMCYSIHYNIYTRILQIVVALAVCASRMQI
jgi:hypothetical protein